ncbi:60S ribosomal protein L16 [Nymphaea thermarum]|nr:60S ribosomal protein L16 [Nymphaea thermarum]
MYLGSGALREEELEKSSEAGRELIKGLQTKGTELGFGRNGTKSYGASCRFSQAIEAVREAIVGQLYRAMSKQFRRNDKIWVRVLIDIPITRKPTKVRMGRGKGNPTGWIARVSTGQIPFEMDGVSLPRKRNATRELEGSLK